MTELGTAETATTGDTVTDTATSVLGTYHERTYYLTIRVTPSFNEIEEFAVAAHYRDPDSKTETEIARIDTSHGYTHFDKLFRRNQPKERLDVDVWEAAKRIETQWRRYAESYERVHA